MFVLAHASHWLTPVIYLAPVLILAAVLGVQSIRDRRRDDITTDPDDRP